MTGAMREAAALVRILLALLAVCSGGPARLDKAIVTKLNAEIDYALRKTDLGDRLLAIGAVPMGGTPKEFGDFIQREIRKYAVVVKAAGIVLE